MDLSIIIISFNTRDLLRRCLTTALQESEGLAAETIVVDNISRDGSPDMVRQEFPQVRLICNDANIGFGPANNIGFAHARGKYVLLLNSDAFPEPGAVRRTIEHMESEPKLGIVGGRLLNPDGTSQPSARMFPSVLRDFLILSGLSTKYAKSRFFGQPDRTWSDLDVPADVDWVPGAYFCIRRDVLERVGYFDEAFYFYYEEVDLCRRVQRAGYVVRYLPDVRVLHLGGESAKGVKHLDFSSKGSQLTLWRMRSGLLYYRKHHGLAAWQVRLMESTWHALRHLRNQVSREPQRKLKAQESQVVIKLLRQAWHDTSGGRLSPPRPW